MKRKVVAVCGSMKFTDKMQEAAERLQLENGWIVIGVTPHVLPRELTADERALMGEIHLAKIDLADAVFIVNPGGYIGGSVRREIDYARAAGKEVIFLEEQLNQGG